MPNFGKKRGFTPQPYAPVAPFDSTEDNQIHNIANYLNDNLKMLLYLVDVDKLKKVQNILFGKSTRKTHMTRKQHSHNLNAAIPRNYQKSPQAIPLVGVQDVMIPKSAYALVQRAAPAPAFIPSYQKIKKIQPHKLTRKHMPMNEPLSPLEESRNLEEVLNE
jgi:hypothetical protein